jgi:hypothetical protein
MIRYGVVVFTRMDLPTVCQSKKTSIFDVYEGVSLEKCTILNVALPNSEHFTNVFLITGRRLKRLRLLNHINP